MGVLIGTRQFIPPTPVKKLSASVIIVCVQDRAEIIRR